MSVKVPRFCEYRVVLSTARGYVNVSKIVKVNPPPEIKTEKYTFTASDIMTMKRAMAVIHLTLIGMGFIIRITLVMTAIDIICELGDLFCNEKTVSDETPYEPRVGWTFMLLWHNAAAFCFVRRCKVANRKTNPEA